MMLRGSSSAAQRGGKKATGQPPLMRPLNFVFDKSRSSLKVRREALGPDFPRWWEAGRLHLGPVLPAAGHQPHRDQNPARALPVRAFGKGPYADGLDAPAVAWKVRRRRSLRGRVVVAGRQVEVGGAVHEQRVDRYLRLLQPRRRHRHHGLVPAPAVAPLPQPQRLVPAATRVSQGCSRRSDVKRGPRTVCCS